MIKKLVLCMLTIMLSSSYMLAQRTVNGTVRDSTGPLPGATVVVKGTTIGATTDFDGKFSIDVPNSDTVLKVGFLLQ
jgi:TonB-dependent starch-binding outer membrane protein SusC